MESKMEKRAKWYFLGLIMLAFASGCGVKSSMLKFGYERDEQSGVRICFPCLDTEKK